MGEESTHFGDRIIEGNMTIKKGLTVEGTISQKVEVPAFEDLAAGDYVDLFDDSGTLKARLAIADDKNNPKKGDGYVDSAVTTGNTATVFGGGTNINVSGLTKGDDVFLSSTVPGGVTTTAPSGGATFAQPLGTAISATSMVVDIDTVPGGDAVSFTVPAFENLVAGDLVNILDDSGTAKAQKADATAAGKEADGYVDSAVTSGNAASVLSGGVNENATGLTIGVKQFLSTTPGLATDTAPSGSGNIVQEVGKSLSATSFLFNTKASVEVA